MYFFGLQGDGPITGWWGGGGAHTRWLTVLELPREQLWLFCVVFLSPTLGNVTSAQFVPDHHFCSLIFPVKPSCGAPWYAIQSTVAKGLKFSCFRPVCITQTVKFSGLISSVQEVTASWTVTESFSLL